MSPKKGRPEISIEWLDVSIEVKVCGVDVPPADRGFVRLFPDLDSRLISREQIDANKQLFRKERKKLQKFEYKLVPNNPAKESTTKVLPKLTCNHCGKSFSRRSTLEQHIASHDQHNSSWEDVQDAALQDLEQAIVFGGVEGAKVEILERDEEAEIPAPPRQTEYRCHICEKNFSRQSNLTKHNKRFHGLIVGAKGYTCTVCGWRFQQKFSLKKHMWAHSIEELHMCVDCHSTFSDNQQLREHVSQFHTDQTGEDLEVLQPESLSTSLIPCPKCDRKFAAKAHLDRHLPVHTHMAKPFACDICGWKFHLLHNMERHRVTHLQKGKKAKVPPHIRERRNSKKKKAKRPSEEGDKADDEDYEEEEEDEDYAGDDDLKDELESSDVKVDSDIAGEDDDAKDKVIDEDNVASEKEESEVEGIDEKVNEEVDEDKEKEEGVEETTTEAGFEDKVMEELIEDKTTEGDGDEIEEEQITDTKDSEEPLKSPDEEKAEETSKT